MWAKIFKGRRVEIFDSMEAYQRMERPLISSSGTQVRVWENPTNYEIIVLFTYKTEVEETTIISMSATVDGYIAEDEADIQLIDNRAYYLQQEIAEEKCRQGEKVGYINTWTNDCYKLYLNGDKIVYKEEGRIH